MELPNTDIVRGAGLPALSYKGSPIHERGEMLSLTDMWRAAGGDPSRQPAEWTRSADAERFIEFLTVSANLGNSQVLKSQQGRGGGTWAHWQIAMAYAKHLSPEFHVWCNEVVRAHMEGRAAPPLGRQRKSINPDAARVSLAREARLTFEAELRVCKALGIVGKHALIHANQACKNRLGVDRFVDLGVKYLEPETDSSQINATTLGQQLSLDPKAANKVLTAYGYQTVIRNAKNKLVYEPTDKGRATGGRVVPTGKRHNDGAPVTQVVWSMITVEALRADMRKATGT